MFTSRINDEVKLVGSTISCEAAYESGSAESDVLQIPHVQSYVVATDQVTLPPPRTIVVNNCFHLKWTIQQVLHCLSDTEIGTNFCIASKQIYRRIQSCIA